MSFANELQVGLTVVQMKRPEWVNLYEEFRRIMKKHMIYEQEGLTMENIKETQTEYQNLFEAFEDTRAE